MALIDSEASSCLISKSVFLKMNADRYPLKSGPRTVRGIGNNHLTLLGQMWSDIEIGGAQYGIDAIISSSDENIGLVLGMDFFQKHDADFSVKEGYFQINGNNIRMRKERDDGPSIARLRLQEDIVIPARTEFITTAEPEKLVRHFNTDFCSVEPSPRTGKMIGKDICVSHSLIRSDMRHVPVSFMNLGDEDMTVRKGTTVAVIKPVTSYSNPPTCHKAKANVTENFIKLEHIAPLMNGISDEVTPCQRNDLQQTLIEFADVFSTGPEDLGRTNMVTHTIDTGDTRPIQQAPRHLPIAKQQIEKDEIQKMLRRGVIEPSTSPWASPVVLATKKDGTTLLP